MLRLVFSGARRWRTNSLPLGSSTRPVAALAASATPCAPGGVSFDQLVGELSAAISCCERLTLGSGGGGGPSTSVLLKLIEKSHQKISNDALPLTFSGLGPSSSPLTE